MTSPTRTSEPQPARPLRILFLEDKSSDLDLMQHHLRREGLTFTPEHALEAAGFLAALESNPPDLILADFTLPQYDGMVALQEARKRCPETPFLFVSGSIGEEVAIEALRRGAKDYVLKQNLARLGPAVRRALRERDEERRRRQAEAELREREAKLSSIFRAAPTGIGVTVNRVLVEVNNHVCEMTGYSQEELLGQSARLLYRNELEYEAAGRVKYRQIAEQGIGSVETKWRRKDGRVVDILLSSTPIVSENPSAGITFTATDITAQKQADDTRSRLERQLRHAQKMEAVGQLAGGIAHDFNNLLTVILGNLSLLPQEHALPPEALELVEQASSAGRRAAELTRRLLTFSRQQVLQFRRLELPAILTRAITLLRRLLGENIELVYQPDETLPAIEADAGMVEQVVVNLAVNARDAMPRGGRVIIQTARQSLSSEQAQANPEARPGDFAVLSVTDNGCGMDEATLGHIFEPFFTTKEVGKGTGLGLATVYGIIRQHRGWIEVNSQPRQGTTFKIFFPACEHTTKTRQTSAPAPLLDRGQETILLVEDEEPVRRLARNCLCRLGYEVLEAANGVEALRVWSQQGQPIDLLLTDVVMPEGMTGRDLAERLRKVSPRLKVLFTSGYSRDILGKDAEDSLDYDYLSKPYDLKSLAQAVRRCLDTEAQSTGSNRK